jgi:ParB family chromosome partitioning protein
LATLFEEGTLKEATALDVVDSLAEDVTSDGRLDAVIKAATQRGPKARAEAPREPILGVAIKSSKSSISVAIKRTGENKEFADWLDNKIDQLIADSFQTFKEQSGE